MFLAYDAGAVPSDASTACFVLLNGLQVLQLDLPDQATGWHATSTTLSLQPGSNTLRIVANIFGSNTRSTSAKLSVTDDKGEQLFECVYETAEPVANVDQSFKLMSAL